MDYNMNAMKEMTIEEYLQLSSSDDEKDYEKASEALSNVRLYLYSNTEGVDDLEIEDEDIYYDYIFRANVSFKTMCEDCNMIQKDVDDFITTDVYVDFDDGMDVEVKPGMTLLEVAEVVKRAIEEKADDEIDREIEKAAEEYREHHRYW